MKNMNDQQATAIQNSIAQLQHDMDQRLRDMKADMDAGQTRLIQWTVGMFISGIVVVTTTMGLFTAYVTGIARLV